MRKRLAVIALTLLLLFNMLSCNKAKTRFEAEFLVLFDTITKIVAYMPDKQEFTKFSQSIYDDLKEYHQLYDIYHDYEGINNIKTINDNAGIAPVKVDKRIIDLLLLAKDLYKSTEGKLNVAFGAVLKLWHAYREEGREDPDNATLPPIKMLKEAELHIDINDVVIDAANSTVFLADSKMSLDVGAIGKGYAVEQICRHAEQKGYGSALVSVGGNVRAIGYKEAGTTDKWNVGIQDPNSDNGESLVIVEIANNSVVTSGSYERYYTVNAKQYSHIIDPATLFPPEYITAVTIVCPDSGLADALSTAIFCMPLEKGKAFIEQLPDTEALWVLTDGRIVYSSGFKNYIQ